MACSVPWPLGKWMDKNHADICAEHDKAYITRVWCEKVRSDFVVAQRFSERGYYLLAYLSVPYLAVFGTIYWLFNKLRKDFI
jgi:hypothetical protein